MLYVIQHNVHSHNIIYALLYYDIHLEDDVAVHGHLDEAYRMKTMLLTFHVCKLLFHDVLCGALSCLHHDKYVTKL